MPLVPVAMLTPLEMAQYEDDGCVAADTHASPGGRTPWSLLKLVLSSLYFAGGALRTRRPAETPRPHPGPMKVRHDRHATQLGRARRGRARLRQPMRTVRHPPVLPATADTATRTPLPPRPARHTDASGGHGTWSPQLPPVRGEEERGGGSCQSERTLSYPRVTALYGRQAPLLQQFSLHSVCGRPRLCRDDRQPVLRAGAGTPSRCALKHLHDRQLGVLGVGGVGGEWGSGRGKYRCCHALSCARCKARALQGTQRALWPYTGGAAGPPHTERRLHRGLPDRPQTNAAPRFRCATTAGPCSSARPAEIFRAERQWPPSSPLPVVHAAVARALFPTTCS